ncbi:phage holin family protein, partial [Klebsiella variicola]|uniref:phage holin family protein n=1 Tax=Klebsiella variicola TaxID=244366 RepID=UPI0027301942
IVQVVGMYVAITYLEVALGISKAVKLKDESLQRAFKSRTFLYSLPLKFTLISCVGILYAIGHVLSQEMAVAFVIPLFVYEFSSIIENLNEL